MRILLDLQSAQVGRDPEKELAFARALIKEGAAHEFWVVLNGRIPDSVEPLRESLAELVPSERCRVFDLPGPLAEQLPANFSRREVAELVREDFITGLGPDIVYVSALFEGIRNEAVASIARLNVIPTIVTIPAGLETLDLESANPAVARAYARRLESLRRADLLLAESQDAARQVPQRFEIPMSRFLVHGGSSLNQAARETLHAMEALLPPPVITNSSGRLRPLLAFVGPLPPERSGIANYSAKLLPHLGRHYDIICVADQGRIADSSIKASFAIRDLAWFEEHVSSFDRIVYQFGNSPAHKHLFELARRHPGVAVLHDFFLSDALAWMTDYQYASNAFLAELYESHGFSAVQYDRQNGRIAARSRYPCNGTVLCENLAVIVHSRYSRELAREWYGDGVADKIREVPFIPYGPPATDRVSARRRLGLSEDFFVVCSFGWITRPKLSDRLLSSWLKSALAKDRKNVLVFIGETPDPEYTAQLFGKIRTAKAASPIQITGFADDATYRDYLSSADVAVQLRTSSRGETSGTIFDCLRCGLPVIANAHGSAAEFPDDVICKISEEFRDDELADTLTRLRTDHDWRSGFSHSGQSYLEKAHHPAMVAGRYHQIIEECYVESPIASENRLIAAISHSPGQIELTDRDIAATAAAISANRQRLGPKRLFVDVTNVAGNDLRTGIERVTRAMMMALITDPPANYRIEPVRAGEYGYSYAREFAFGALEIAPPPLPDDLIETFPGDLFLGLDWSVWWVPTLAPWFKRQRERGTRLFFVVYDCLPLLKPELFLPEIEPLMRRWLQTLASLADGIACISRSVAADLYNWLNETEPSRLRPLPISYFHLGADLQATVPTKGLLPGSAQLLDQIKAAPSFLMVGTLEARKGYRQALAAFDLLWGEGVQANLVIVGKQGWKMDDIADRLRTHPEKDRRLFWLQGISDEMLEEIYCGVRALLAPSEGEGFGLPLIEAAQHGVPIIARDLPVFREVVGDHAYYFEGNEPGALAGALKNWLASFPDVPSSTGVNRLSWAESSRQLLEFLLEAQRIYRWWPKESTSVEKTGRPEKAGFSAHDLVARSK